MAHDVFISYSSKDAIAGSAVCAALESRGVRCWIAPRDVLAGEEYAEALVNAVNGSRLLVLLFSAASNSSPQVLREVERAVSKGLPILPLRIDDVAPSRAMEYYIASRHWFDARTPPLDRHLGPLADNVASLLTRASTVAIDDTHFADATAAVPRKTVVEATNAAPGEASPAPPFTQPLAVPHVRASRPFAKRAVIGTALIVTASLVTLAILQNRQGREIPNGSPSAAPSGGRTDSIAPSMTPVVKQAPPPAAVPAADSPSSPGRALVRENTKQSKADSTECAKLNERMSLGIEKLSEADRAFLRRRCRT